MRIIFSLLILAAVLFVMYILLIKYQYKCTSLCSVLMEDRIIV